MSPQDEDASIAQKVQSIQATIDSLCNARAVMTQKEQKSSIIEIPR